MLFFFISTGRPQSSSWLFCCYGACWVCSCCHNPPDSDMDYRVFNVRTDVNACDCTWGVRTPKESLHWKLTLGRKSLVAPGNRTFVSGLTGRYSNQLSYIPSPELTELISTATDSPFVGVGHTQSRRRWVNCKKAFAFISLSLKAVGPSTMADSHNFESQQPG